MKIATIFISLLIILFACRPAKKIQKTSEAISNSKIDTTVVAATLETKAADSTQLIKDVFNRVLKNKINFTTFNAKVKAAYKSNEGDEDATAYIRLKKDSVIWLSLRGPLGIEGFRIFNNQRQCKSDKSFKEKCSASKYFFIARVHRHSPGFFCFTRPDRWKSCFC